MPRRTGDGAVMQEIGDDRDGYVETYLHVGVAS